MAEVIEAEIETGIPNYELSEWKSQQGLTVSIFDLQLEDLVYEKMITLFEKYTVIERELETAKIDLQVNKDKMLLETDFKKELNESRPTVAMKEAYMKPYLAKYEEAVDKLKQEHIFYKNKLAIINDLIKIRREALKIEGALAE